jgi:hypothetical protein
VISGAFNNKSVHFVGVIIVCLTTQLQIVKGEGKGKSKVHPRTGHEGPEGE